MSDARSLRDKEVAALGDALLKALRSRRPIAPFGEARGLTIADAYAVSRRLLEHRLAEGERLVGKKIGVTSEAVQSMLDVRQPDFGYLTDAMQYENGAQLPISTVCIQPRAEGELAFRLCSDLVGPGVDEAAVLSATDAVFPCFEIVDSRIEDWQIRIQDTVADNASSGLFVLGKPASPTGVDFFEAQMRVFKNGALLSSGRASAALGSPLTCVAWLANTMGRFGVPLKAGEVILSGSWVPLEPVVPGDHMRLEIEGVGSAVVGFV